MTEEAAEQMWGEVRQIVAELRSGHIQREIA